MWKTARVVVSFVVATATIPASHADEAAVEEVYGRGVHAYYSGNFQRSYDTLSKIVRLETTDPRVYYFRGLAALKLGSRDDAIKDFTEGANLETTGWSIRAVSRSLERIQGEDRLLLERLRLQARLLVVQRRERAVEVLDLSQMYLGVPRNSGVDGGVPFDRPPPALDKKPLETKEPVPLSAPMPTSTGSGLPKTKSAPAAKPKAEIDLDDDFFDSDPF